MLYRLYTAVEVFGEISKSYAGRQGGGPGRAIIFLCHYHFSYFFSGRHIDYCSYSRIFSEKLYFSGITRAQSLWQARRFAPDPP